MVLTGLCHCAISTGSCGDGSQTHVSSWELGVFGRDVEIHPLPYCSLRVLTQTQAWKKVLARTYMPDMKTRFCVLYIGTQVLHKRYMCYERKMFSEGPDT